MAKVNYRHLKRLKETARKNRKQEKLDRRAAKETTSTPGATPVAPNGEEATAVPANALP
jgi:hypothetical protein